VECLPIKKIWSKYRNDAGIKRSAFEEYFYGRKEGFVIRLSKPRRFKRNLTAHTLNTLFGFVAPQSFVYLPAHHYSLLEDAQLQITH
jgi:predicted transcriptional regulator